MEAMNIQQLEGALCDRLSVYRLLARLFRSEVDEELFTALRDGGLFEVDGDAAPAGGLPGTPDPLREGVQMMRSYMQAEGSCVLDLRRDYAKAFCGAGSTKRDAAYPFESVYTSEKGMLMQEARDEALAWYRRFGLTKAASWNDCEDHLGLELEFMAFLIDGCRTAVEAGDAQKAGEMLAAQRDFAREHLARWLPEFDRDVDGKARTLFYRGLARFTSRYVQQDLAALDALDALPAA